MVTNIALPKQRLYEFALGADTEVAMTAHEMFFKHDEWN